MRHLHVGGGVPGVSVPSPPGPGIPPAALWSSWAHIKRGSGWRRGRVVRDQCRLHQRYAVLSAVLMVVVGCGPAQGLHQLQGRRPAGRTVHPAQVGAPPVPRKLAGRPSVSTAHESGRFQRASLFKDMSVALQCSLLSSSAAACSQQGSHLRVRMWWQVGRRYGGECSR